MKKLLFIIISVFILSANSVFALKYSESLSISSNYFDVSKQHKSEAKLLQNYVLKYKEDINNVYKIHTRWTTPMMRDTNIILDDMLVALEMIQNKQVNPGTVEGVMLSIVADIKILNSRVKVYLTERQKIHELKIQTVQQEYIWVGKRISNILDDLTTKITAILSQKNNLTESEKLIIKSLDRIRVENNKIKAFKNLKFNSEAEMQIYFKNIALNLRKEILIIKGASK